MDSEKLKAIAQEIVNDPSDPADKIYDCFLLTLSITDAFVKPKITREQFIELAGLAYDNSLADEPRHKLPDDGES